MSNVKEGDLAVLVDPTGPNHGARVCVTHEYTGPKGDRPGLTWWIQPLQIITATTDWTGGKKGDRIFIPCIASDSVLRRIDPDGPEEVIVREKEFSA